MSAEGRKGIPIGLQLYTLRQRCQADFLDCLRTAARLGFRSVEGFFGLFGAGVDEVRGVLAESGLQVGAAHVPLDQLSGGLDEAADLWASLRCTELVCPWLDEEARRDLAAVGARLGAIATRLADRGIGLSYHNHDFELAAGADGLETLLAAARPAPLALEVDVYWLAYAGVDPADYLRRHAADVRFVHLKDGRLGGRPEFCALGDGDVDLAGVLTAAGEIGVAGCFVEQDATAGSIEQDLGRSVEFLRRHGMRDGVLD